MKKPAIFLVLVFLTTPLIHAVEIHLKFSTGLNWIRPAGINQVLQDWLAFYKTEAEAFKNFHFLGGEAVNLRSSINLEGEILVSLSSHFAVSIGSGLIYGNIPQKSTETSVEKLAGTFIYVHPLQISSIPFILSGYTFLNLGNRFSIYMKGGAGLSWAKFIERDGRRLLPNKNFSYQKMNSATARSPVYQAGGGFLFKVESGIRLFLEGTYRKVSISDFSGENKQKVKGHLYFFEEYNANLDFWKSQYAILEEVPSGEAIRSAEKAVIDLSGFTLKLGLIIRF